MSVLKSILCKCRKYHCFCIFVFLCTVYSFAFCGTLFKITNICVDAQLMGYFDSYERPKFSMGNFKNGIYQTGFENWLNTSLLPRGYFIKLYNQIQYSLFDEGNRIIGKDGSIFEMTYVSDFLSLDVSEDFGIAMKDNRASLERYVDQLESVASKLEAIDKHLLVYITPSKATYESKKIPYKYLVQKDDSKERCISYFKNLMAGRDIEYLDYNTILAPDEDYPIFYNTGIHWSRPAEQEMSVAIINELKKYNVGIRNIELKALRESETPYWRDADVFDLLNIYTGPKKKEKYYKYDTLPQYPEHYDNINMLLQGGSFAEGLRMDILSEYPDENIDYINYNQSVIDAKGNVTEIVETNWKNLGLSFYLNQADFVVIELNEAVISRQSNGFVEYLDKYLDSYKPGYILDKEE